MYWLIMLYRSNLKAQVEQYFTQISQNTQILRIRSCSCTMIGYTKIIVIRAHTVNSDNINPSWNDDFVTRCADTALIARNSGYDCTNVIAGFADEHSLQLTPEAVYAVDCAVAERVRSAAFCSYVGSSTGQISRPDVTSQTFSI